MLKAREKKAKTVFTLLVYLFLVILLGWHRHYHEELNSGIWKTRAAHTDFWTLGDGSCVFQVIGSQNNIASHYSIPESIELPEIGFLPVNELPPFYGEQFTGLFFRGPPR